MNNKQTKKQPNPKQNQFKSKSNQFKRPPPKKKQYQFKQQPKQLGHQLNQQQQTLIEKPNLKLQLLKTQLLSLNTLKNTFSQNKSLTLNPNQPGESTISSSNHSSLQLEKAILSILQLTSINQILFIFDFNYNLFYYNHNELTQLIELLFFFKTQKTFLSFSDQTRQGAISYFDSLICFYKKIPQLSHFLAFFDITDTVKAYYSKASSIMSNTNFEVNALLTVISLFQLQDLYDPHIVVSWLFHPTTEIFIIDFLSMYKDSPNILHEAITAEKYQLEPKTTKRIIESAQIKDKPQLKEELLLSYTDINMNNVFSLSLFILLAQEHSPNSSRVDYKRLVNQCIELFLDYNCTVDTLKFINQIKKNEVIDIELIKSLLVRIPYEKINWISMLIKAFPSVFSFVVNDYANASKTKELMRLLKALPGFEIEDDLKKKLSEFSLGNYYNYKVNECIFNSQFDLILDFALCNEDEFNVALSILLRRRKPFRKELMFLANRGFNKGYKFSEKNRNEMIKLFGLEFEKGFLAKDDQWEKDCFGARTRDEECLTLSKEVNVVFSESIEEIRDFFEKYLVKSEYIGIDSEWKQTRTMFDKCQASLLQLSDWEGRNVLLVDMVKVGSSEQLLNAFKLLSKATFVAFGFKNDLENFDKPLRKLFKDEALFQNLQMLYLSHSKKSPPSPGLSTICKEFFGQALCKYEQCSNWENRPLRQSQMHYAALDAIVCVRLYKQLAPHQ